MLTRPEIGTLEHIKLWVAGKPHDEGYEWLSADCPANRYMDEHGLADDKLPAIRGLNALAHTAPHTFGALCERLV